MGLRLLIKDIFKMMQELYQILGR